MGNMDIQDYNLGSVVIKNPEYETGLLQFPGADTYAEGTILARKAVAATITPVADEGNTGDGTVTAQVYGTDIVPKVGSYVLECEAAGDEGRAAGTVTADAGNTGNGTVTSLAIVSGETPEIGSFVLECTDADSGGTATAAAVFTGTGNGGISAVTTGNESIEGDYIATCTDATVSGSEIFEVIDPNGAKLENATVAVAYSNDHLGFTIADGDTDYIVGDYYTITVTIAHGGKFTLTDPNGVDLKEDIELPGTAAGTVDVESGGISFTVTDGDTDFAVGDKFTLTVVAAEGGTFSLTDPNGNILKDDIELPGTSGGSKTVYIDGLKIVITDGSTDFVDGDKFTIPVVADGDWVIYDADGVGGAQIPKGVLTVEEVRTASGDSPVRVLIKGVVRADKLVIDAGDTVTNAVKDALREVGIVALDTTDLSVEDND